LFSYWSFDKFILPFQKPKILTGKLINRQTGVIFILPRPASTQGLLGNSVLQFSPSAVANGMGNGFVAASTEASSIHYNPAALTRLGRFAIEGNTFELFQDARYHHVAGAFQAPFFNRLWLGAAYTHLGLSIPIYELNVVRKPPRLVGKREDYEWAFLFAAAVKISHHASLGVAFKHGRSGLDVGTESLRADPTYALDLGFLYEGFLPVAHISRREGRQPLPSKNRAAAGLAPGFSLGVTLTNISLNRIFNDADTDLLTQIDADPTLPPGNFSPEIDGAATDDFLLKKLRIGLAWNFFESNKINLVATGELAKPLNEIAERCNAFNVLPGIFIGDRDENEPTFAAGLEVNLLRLAAIRIGRHWGDISPHSSHSNGGFIVIPVYGRNCRSEYDIGYNAFGFSIGPPGLRFSYAKILYDDNILFPDRQIYTASIVLDKLPWVGKTR
jgi:hypothetical protein